MKLLGRLQKYSILFVAILLIISNSNCANGSSSKLYLNQFAVHIQGGEDVANAVAKEKDYINKGQIGGLKDYYLFEVHHLAKRSLDYSHQHHSSLKEDFRVLWTEQQHAKRRVKRSLSFQNIPDPLYPQQWYLTKGAQGNYDMNLLPAWEEGYTGKGVVVTILDDGIQTNHPDLIQNYDPQASTDINGHDNDPMPQDDNKNKHGTRCAGEVAATAFNEFCGIGVAFNASIGGVRMLDGTVTDEVEARALSLNRNHIHIYSASWGPEDDGKTVDGPGRLAKQAFIEGINQGRDGKGSIFVWASGNGGRFNDNCNCDGYTNSIYTLSISSATQEGRKPWYLEECSSTLATTYSSGTFGHDRSVVTVDMDMSYFNQRDSDPSKLCTKSHTGTSASAPIAAGLCALTLEANPNLTWRDIQYIVLLTSRPQPLLNENGWTTNAVGRRISHKFGYGMMDAGAMVKLAKKWITVPPQVICHTKISSGPRVIPLNQDDKLEVDIETDGCEGTMNQINYLEHVQVVVSLSFYPRGNLHIVLVSPSGTRSSVLFPRSGDTDERSLNNWPFLSVHFWGEKPQGTWKLIINNGGSQLESPMVPGSLYQWNLVLYGTLTNPIQTPGENHTHDVREASQLKYTGSCKTEKKFWNKGICADECPAGSYADHVEWACMPCHQSCKTCYGPTQDNCQTCPSFQVLMEDHCVTTCPSGFYSEENLGECLPCQSDCLNCKHDPKICTSCKPGYLLYHSSCLSSCPDRTYMDSKQKCVSCDDNCFNCDGPGPNSCLSCRTFSLLHQRKCLPSCPEGYYGEKGGLGSYCTLCEIGCQNCTSDTECKLCRNDWSLDKAKQMCLLSCSSDNTCKGGCEDNCLHCHDGQCASCRPNWVLYQDHCLDKCPTGYYSTEHRQCLKCPPFCGACTSPNECTKCESKYFLVNKICNTHCPSTSFPKKDGTCSDCHSSCVTCKGLTEKNCTSCKDEFHLMDGICHKGDCPSTHFVDHMHKCEPCHHHCLSCVGPTPTSCTSCKPDSYFKDNVCIPCMEREYYDSGTQSCQACDASCDICFGPSAEECSACKLPLRIDTKRHMCLPCCKFTGFEGECCPCNGDNSRECFRPEGGLPHSFKYMVVGACSISVLMFILLFSMLQVRTRGCRLTRRYRLVPVTTAKFDSASEKVSLTRDNDDEEDDEKL